jgi:predicted small metal-binding protein
MAKELQCSDVGFACDAVIRGESEDDVMNQAARHGQEVHGMTEEDLREPATAEKIRSSIRDAA